MKKRAFFFCFIFIQLISIAQQREIDSLQKIISSKVHDSLRIKAYVQWDNLIYSSNPDKDLELNREIISLAKKALEKKKLEKKEKDFFYRAQAKAYNNIGSYFTDRNDYSKALENYEKSRSLGVASKNLEIQAQAYMNMCRAMRYKGDIKEAIQYGKKGITLEEKATQGKGNGSSYNLMGNLYRGLGDFAQALKYFQKALTYSEKTKDEKEKGSSLLNYGLVYYELSDYDRANGYYLKSLASFKSVDFDRGSAIVLINLANIKQQLKEYDSALVYYNEGLNFIQKIKDVRSETGILNNIGIVYTRTGENKKALEYILKAYDLRIKQEDEVGQAVSLNLLGDVYINLKQYPKAIESCKKGYDLALKTGSLPEQRDNCACLFRVYKAQGNGISALLYHEKYIQLRDTLTNAEKAGEIARLDEQYKFKKEMEADSIRNLEKDKLQKAEIEKQKAISDSNEAQLNSKKLQQNYLYIGLAVVVVFSIIIFNRFKASQNQKKLIEIKERETHEQKLIIEEKQKEIVDSINYAKRIQYSLLAHDEMLKNNLKDFFVLFKPKDIVSGDFYWATKKRSENESESAGHFYLAICDSTGHGVPGAFMSLLNISFLNEAINEKNISEPHLVLNHVRQRLIENMEGGKDGMDAQLIRLSGTQLTYAASHNKPLLIRNNEITELPADKMPVGMGEKNDSFTLYEFNLQKNDLLYFCTDGFADQFGGAKGKKFKSTNLQKVLLEISSDNLETQKSKLETAFTKWKGDLEQIDDVCIIGIKI